MFFICEEWISHTYYAKSVWKVPHRFGVDSRIFKNGELETEAKTNSGHWVCPLLACTEHRQSPLFASYEHTHKHTPAADTPFNAQFLFVRYDSRERWTKINGKNFQVHVLFIPNFLKVLVKSPDFLQTSWPTFRILDFFQTFGTCRHHRPGTF